MSRCGGNVSLGLSSTLPVERRGGASIGLNDGPIDRNASKDSTASRIGEDLCTELPIGCRRSAAADRPGRGAGIGTDREAAPHHFLDPRAVAKDEDKVGRLQAGLKTDVSARNGDEDRIRPGTIGIASNSNAAAMLEANDEPTTNHSRDDDKTLRFREKRSRDSPGWNGHNLLEHVAGRDDDLPFIGLSASDGKSKRSQ